MARIYCALFLLLNLLVPSIEAKRGGGGGGGGGGGDEGAGAMVSPNVVLAIAPVAILMVMGMLPRQ